MEFAPQWISSLAEENKENKILNHFYFHAFLVICKIYEIPYIGS
jgi:hypothetical protein